MEKARIYALIFLALLCVLLPLGWLLFSYLTPAIPADLAAYSYFAVTAPEGEERIFRPHDAVFISAAAAFTDATVVDELPQKAQNGLFLTAEWIRDDRAIPYRLYLSPSPLFGYLVDDRDRVFALSEEGCLFFLGQPFAVSLLVGEAPPLLTVDGDRVLPFSLCRWDYTVRTPSGETVTLSSGDCQNDGVTALPVDPTLTLSFAEMPDFEKYTVYSAAGTVLESESLPDLAALPSGEYQLVLIATWQKDNAAIRAGYSFLLTVP